MHLFHRRSFLGKLSLLAGSLLLTLGATPSLESKGEKPPRYNNLQVLSKDISRQELGQAMLENLRGLGLPRREGRGCLFCHVGSLDQPRSEWDWASDAKAEKRKARVMMTMVRDINSTYFPQLEERIAGGVRVTCATCHAGRTDPRPLPEIVLAAYEEGGVAALEGRYRELRQEHFGGDSYDFRPPVLNRIAFDLADDSLADAIAVAALNREFHSEDPGVHGSLVLLLLERTLEKEGVPTALASLERQAGELPPEVNTPGLLDSLGWRLMRTERQGKALLLFLANRERFPAEYLPAESLASAYFDQGEKERAFGILEDWLEQNPDHDRARRLLINLQSRE